MLRSPRALGALLFLGLLAFVMTWISLSEATTPAPYSYTGAPGEGNCSSCHFHNETNSNDPGSISITLEKNMTSNPIEYQGGDWIWVNVTVDSGTTTGDYDSFGFSILAMDRNETTVGQWDLVTPDPPAGTLSTDTDTVNATIRTYVASGAQGQTGTDSKSWSIGWKASAHYGDVTFYYSGVASDFNNENHTYAGKTVLEGVNRAPRLSDPAVNPRLDNESADYVFSVQFTDADGDEPNDIRVIIDEGLLNLSLSNASASPTYDGRSYDLSLPGTAMGIGAHTFTFYAVDEAGVKALGQGTATNKGPDVNDLPTLTAAGLAPANGTSETFFNFTVTYSDPNTEQLPEYVNVTLNGVPISMTQRFASDTDYTDGAQFFLQLRMSDGGTPLHDGWNTYRFNATDGISYVNTTDSRFLINNAPSLSNGTVEPSPGGESDTYYFNVTYTDPNGDPPSEFWLDVAGVGTFNLTTFNVGGDNYSFSIAGMAWGYHNFSFEAADNHSVNATGDTGTHELLVNDVPTATDLAVTPTSGALWTGYTFNATVTDPNVGQGLAVYLVVAGQPDRPMTTSGDVTTGANYLVEVPGSDLGSGTHSFTVRVEDNFTSTTSNAMNAPTVNYAPTLTDPTVTPGNGWLGTDFNFTVTYTDQDNDTGPLVELVINDGVTDRTYTTTRFGNDSFGEGRTFYYLINGTLNGTDPDGGDLTFWFRANDTRDDVISLTRDLYISPKPVEVRAPEGMVLLPGTHDYDFTIFNYQAKEDTFDLTNSSAWEVVTLVGGLPADNLTVAASSDRMITLRLTVPVVRNGTTDDLTLNATSRTDTDLTSEDALTTILDRFGGTTVTAQAPVDVTSLQGTVVSFDFNVTNDGNENDTFSFTAVSDRGWFVTTPGDETIAYQGWATVTVDVTIPDDRNGTTSIITLTAESLYDGAARQDTATARVALYGRADLDEPADLSGPPGTLTYTFTITNNGNEDDVYTIDAVSQNGWDLTFDGTLPVPYSGTNTFDVELTIPHILMDSAVDKLTVTITSTNDNGQTDQYTLTTGVDQIAGVQVSAPADGSARPGTTITYTFAITNQGNGNDTFDLSYVVPNGWGVSEDTSIGPLTPGQTGTVEVDVTLPASAIDNFGTSADLTVTAISQFPGGVLDIATVTTTIDQAYAVDLAFAPAITSVNLIAGQDTPLTIVVDNLGNGPDTLRLETSGSGAAWVRSLTPTTHTEVASGGSAQSTLTLRAPTGTATNQQSTLVIKATTHDASQTLQLTLRIDTGSYDHRAGFDTGTITINVGESGRVNFTVTNTGDSEGEFYLSTAGIPTGWPDPLFNSANFKLASGAFKTLPVEIRVPGDLTDPGPYDLSLNTIHTYSGQFQSGIIQVTVNLPQTTSSWTITPDTSVVASNHPTTFTLSNGARAFGDALTIDWDFGDGSSPVTDGGVTQTHTYSLSGEYTITLTITDEPGLITYFSFPITVDNEAPTEISPPKLNEQDLVGDGRFIILEDEELTLTITRDQLDSLDPDGTVAALVVDWDDGKTQIPAQEWSSSSEVSVTHVYTHPREKHGYSLQVYALDNAGAAGDPFSQTIIVNEAKFGMSTASSIFSFLMIFLTFFVGVLLLAATRHYESKQQEQTSPGGGISFRPTSPDPAFTPAVPSELSDEDRKRIDELEHRLERLAEKEELMEVASYDATRVTTMLENHLKQFDEILIRAQELAAKERLEHLQKEMDELEQRQQEDELAETDPDIERLSVAFTETLHRLVKTREKLSKIEGQLTNILKQERDEYEMELERVSQTYDETVRKIRALEELAQMRAQSQDEQTLMDLLTAEGQAAEGGYGDLAAEGDYADEGYEDEEYEDYEDEEYEDLTEEDGEVAECGECGADIPADASECPNCGATFED